MALGQQEIRGWEPQIQVEGTFFAVQSGDLDYTQSTARGDNTDAGPYPVHVPDKTPATFNFTATRKGTLNPHAEPFNIAEEPGAAEDGGDSGNLELDFSYWPTGETSDPTKAWRCQTAIVTKYNERFSAEQGLVILTISGNFSGPFLRPGDPD